jgi:hypothetical protein
VWDSLVWDVYTASTNCSLRSKKGLGLRDLLPQALAGKRDACCKSLSVAVVHFSVSFEMNKLLILKQLYFFHSVSVVERGGDNIVSIES